MDKKRVVYTHNGILFCLEKEGNSDTHTIMWVKLEDMLGEISPSQKYKYYMMPLTGGN